MTDRYSYADLSVTIPSDTTIKAYDGPESSDIESFRPESPHLNNPRIPPKLKKRKKRKKKIPSIPAFVSPSHLSNAQHLSQKTNFHI
jgi:hypothetical protein